VLARGSKGHEVQKLQRLLNLRLASTPLLRLDGIFGLLTHEAVLQYQKGVSTAVDGIVGKRTWYHLLKGDKVKAAQAAPVAQPKVASPPTPPPPVPDSVWDWPFEKKIVAVLERVPKRLPERAKNEFMALLHFESLALALAIICGLALLSGGTALVVAIFALGLDVAMSLAAALQITALAANEEELDEAADELAHIIIAVGVAAFIKGIGKIAKGVKGGSAGEAPTKPPPKPASEPPPSKPAPKPLQPEPPPPPAGATGATSKALPVPKVTDPKLQNIVRDLYKGTKSKNPIGSGSTADAIRNELSTGNPTGGTYHSDKGAQYARALEKWLSKNPNASQSDRMVAQQLHDDLVSALKGN
jgi:Putative peptidoglycan binding domain